MHVHKESKSLILALRDPGRVTSVVPKARAVPDANGMTWTQVFFGLDEARVLRNMGIAAPSPIRYFYDFPIRHPHKPFEHQVTTAEFFTLNPRGICLNDMGCVDAATEYLSPTGWQRIDQYAGGKVAQYVPESGAVEFVDPTEYVKKPCPEMIRFKTSRGVDQLLSPEHRVLYVGSTGKTAVSQAHQVEASHHEAAYGWKGRFITTFSADTTLPGLALTDDQLRLQVAVIADGHFPNGTHRVTVRLKKQRKIDRLRDLLASAGVEAYARPSKATGFMVFSFLAPVRTKEFGSEFWEATAQQLAVVADECVHWDGSERKADSSEFFSTSKASADFVQYAFAASGRTASVTVDRREGRADCYVVHARSEAALLYLCGTNDGKKSETVWREPSPDGFKYCFMVPSTFLLLRRNGCIFATGNTGKTLSALWSADYLMEQKQVGKAIIVCPKSTLSSVWENEVAQHFMSKRTTAVLTGSRERRLKQLKRDVDFYIINHDGLKVIADELRKRPDINLWILDEASEFRNAETARHKLFADLVRPTDWLWLMTGTPCPAEPTDAWGLAKLLHGNRVVPRYYTHFRNQVMTQITTYKWVPKPDAYEKAYDILQPGIRFTKEACISLPPVTFQTRMCSLSPDQVAMYKEMITTMVANLRGVEITAANAAVKMGKLRQVCVGSIYDEHGVGYSIDSSDRLAVCEEVCEEAARKVIVFVPVTHALDKVAQHLSKRWSVEKVDGRTSDSERKVIFDNFQRAQHPRILVAHPQTTAHGLTLTEADTTIWYAPIDRLDLFEQANNRMNRPGQKHKMTVVMLAATMMEQNLYQALKTKQNVQDSVLSLFKSELGLS